MKLKKQILHDWPEGSTIAAICLRLVKALKKSAVLDHYTFYDLQEMAHASESSELAAALLYLSNPSLKILKPSLLYEEREGRLVELDESEIDHYITQESLVDPATGSLLDANEVLISFLPGDRLARADKRAKKHS